MALYDSGKTGIHLTFKRMTAAIAAFTLLLAMSVALSVGGAAAAEAPGWKQIATSQSHSVGLKTDGTVWTWGNNTYGQLGIGTSGADAGQSSPVQVKGLTGVVSVAAGTSHSLAVKNDGTVWSWGSNASGQLGDGTITYENYMEKRIVDNHNRSVPIQVKDLSGIVSVAAGWTDSYAVSKDGSVWKWGSAFWKAEGKSLYDDSALLPVQMKSVVEEKLDIFGPVSALSVGWSGPVALMEDHTVSVWGNTTNGELGDGTIGDGGIGSPAQVPELSDVASASSGANYTLVAKSDGSVWTWGAMRSGNQQTNVSKPAKVTGLIAMKQVVAGKEKQFALDRDGNLWAWEGFTVAGGSVKAVMPAKIVLPGKVVFIAAGGGSPYAVAILEDGTAYAWGSNQAGQLGIGSTKESMEPVQIGTGISAQAAAASVQTQPSEAADKSASVLDSDAITVTLDGEKLIFDQPAQTINNRTMVPMRKIFEAMGATVDWNDKTQTVTATKGKKVVKATIGSTTATVDGKEVTLVQAPVKIGGKTLVPVRIIELFGAGVKWDAETRMVKITSAGN